MKKWFIAAAILILLGLLVNFFDSGETPAVTNEPAATSSKKPQAAPTALVGDYISDGVATVEPDETPALPPVPKGALGGEMTLTYPDDASAEAALARLRAAGYTILGYNRALKTIRVRVKGPEERAALARLAGPEARPGYNFTVETPTPPPGTKTGGGTQAFGYEAVKWMGGTGEASVGKGIKVAVVDTGDTGHGASVASLVSGLSTGIAPGAEVLSISSLGNDGQGDAYTVAEGIVAATDAGARIINLSLGTYGDAAVLQAAVDYAQASGAIVVAAVGNDGAGQVMYPAAYDGVVGVAAVDATGQTATFSNYGEGVDISAPGVGITTYWAEDPFSPETIVSFSGTSASTPLVSGALAALLSENPTMSNEQAVQILTSTANDSGAPGSDAYLGAGSANLERMLNYNQSGISDVAIADHYVAGGDGGAVTVMVTVQNRGTDWAGNLTLDIAYEGRQQSYLIGGINPGETVSQEILLNPTLVSQSGTTVSSRVTGSTDDAHPDDNSRVTRISLKQEEKK